MVSISEPVVQMAISSMLRYKNHRAAAAGIAGLVGNCSISEAGVGEDGKTTIFDWNQQQKENM